MPAARSFSARCGPMPSISSSDVDDRGGGGGAPPPFPSSGAPTGSTPTIGTELGIGGGSVAIASLSSLRPSRVRSEKRVVAVWAACMLSSRRSTDATVSSMLSRAASPAVTRSATSRTRPTRTSTRSTPPIRIVTVRRSVPSGLFCRPPDSATDPDVRRLARSDRPAPRGHERAEHAGGIGDGLGQRLGGALEEDADEDLRQPVKLARALEHPAREHEALLRRLQVRVVEPVLGGQHRVALGGQQIELLPDRGVDHLVEPLPRLLGNLQGAQDLRIVAALRVQDAGDPRAHGILEDDVRAVHRRPPSLRTRRGRVYWRLARSGSRRNVLIGVWLWLPAIRITSRAHDARPVVQNVPGDLDNRRGRRLPLDILLRP